ncbi:MAG: encapsulin [Terriglobales bacterium]
MGATSTAPIAGTPPGTAPSGAMPTSSSTGAPPQPGNQRGSTPAMPPPPGAGAHHGNGAGGDDSGTSIHHEGRKKLPWGPEVWQRIDKAVEMEMKRTRTGTRFLQVRRVTPKTLTVPTDAYTSVGGVFQVDEGAATRVVTLACSFQMTAQQIAQEAASTKELGNSTAVTLATRAANALAQAEDTLIFQGANALGTPLFAAGGPIIIQGTPADTGLLNLPLGAAAAGPLVPPVAVLPVPRAAAPGPLYGSNTFQVVSQAYSQLQALGHYGPYALVLHTIPYADTYVPIADLAVTADVIKPLVTAGFFGTGTLPPNPVPPAAPAPPYYGVLVSLGGNTVDLVVGLEATTAILQENAQGFQLQVIERIALRFKDTTGVIALTFN